MERKLTDKIQSFAICEGSRSRHVPLLRLNGSAKILPQDFGVVTDMVKNFIGVLHEGEIGEPVRVSAQALVNAATGDSELSEEELVKNLLSKDPQIENGLCAIRTDVFTGGKFCTVAVIDTRDLKEIPYSDLLVIYDHH